jgi:epoxyqueuosine reductase
MFMTDRQKLSELIKQKAAELGFDLCGIAKARALSEAEPVLRKWCDAGMNDTMGYLNRDIDKRVNPASLFTGTTSVVVTGTSYYTEPKQKDGVPVISRYAYGRKYQDVISGQLEELLDYIKHVEPNAEGKAVCDTAPLLEKRWAVEAGLGWQGKHSIVINRVIGSFFFIGILLLNLELEYDEPVIKGHCGECRMCIDQCPTKAINDDFTIDARKCISNLTIENRNPVPAEFIPLLGGRIYACDKCQEVCPWNKVATPHNHPEFEITSALAEMTMEEWAALTGEKFKELFSESPVGRVKFDRFRTNLDAIMKSNQEGGC